MTLDLTLVSDMTFYCRPDVIGRLDSRPSKSQVEQIGHAKITQTDAFNYMSYHFLCKRGIRPARTEQFLVRPAVYAGWWWFDLLRGMVVV